jgi:prepilin-type N-terminal cleavage/methylation domain-containing protein
MNMLFKIKTHNLKLKRGFTLIEVLIVTAIVTILAAAVIIAVNPARQFATARNTQRWTAVNSILNAIYQNMVDNQGVFDFSGCDATSIPTSTNPIAKTGGVDLCGCLVPTYLASLPYDPITGSYTDCTTYDTGYDIIRDDTSGRITVSASDAEFGELISVTR